MTSAFAATCKNNAHATCEYDLCRCYCHVLLTTQTGFCHTGHHASCLDRIRKTGWFCVCACHSTRDRKVMKRRRIIEVYIENQKKARVDARARARERAASIGESFIEYVRRQSPDLLKPRRPGLPF